MARPFEKIGTGRQACEVPNIVTEDSVIDETPVSAQAAVNSRPVSAFVT
jgi:hypothetical protein